MLKNESPLNTRPSLKTPPVTTQYIRALMKNTSFLRAICVEKNYFIREIIDDKKCFKR